MRGIQKRPTGWVVVYRQKYLGHFTNLEDAVHARKKAELDDRGFIASHEIEVYKDYIKIPLWKRNGELHGWAVTDVDKLPLVEGRRWTQLRSGYAVSRGRANSDEADIMFLHRMVIGAPQGKRVDHIDGDKLNNRLGNLRLCSDAQNSRNSRLALNNTTGAKGVTKTATGRYRARITYNYKEIHIGTFDDVQAAYEAYAAKAAELHGDFASPVRRA